MIRIFTFTHFPIIVVNYKCHSNTCNVYFVKLSQLIIIHYTVRTELVCQPIVTLLGCYHLELEYAMRCEWQLIRRFIEERPHHCTV